MTCAVEGSVAGTTGILFHNHDKCGLRLDAVVGVY